MHGKDSWKEEDQTKCMGQHSSSITFGEFVFKKFANLVERRMQKYIFTQDIRTIQYGRYIILESSIQSVASLTE